MFDPDQHGNGFRRRPMVFSISVGGVSVQGKARMLVLQGRIGEDCRVV